MAINNDKIAKNIEQIKNATYGKDVRAAIAEGLELCYEYTSGEGADEAAQRANAAAERVEGLITASEQAVQDVQDALVDIDDIVLVQPNQPGSNQNKIWIQPQDDTEYKVATFAAYEALWNRMNEINETYEQGHGGIASIVLDEDYEDPEDPLKRRYIVTYSDQTTGEFFVEDGPEGPQGDIDTIEDVRIHYKKVSSQSFTPTPPTDFVDNLPTLNEGDYLWTITEIIYASGTNAYLYGLSRMGMNGANGRDGIDGSGAVNAVALGDGDPLTNDGGTVRIPMDQEPNVGSGSLLTSGAIYTALQAPTFTGSPTAPTPSAGDDSTKLATTAFVNRAISSISVSSVTAIEVTMNGTSLEYENASLISDTTAVIGFADFEGGTFSSAIVWQTTDSGKLILTTATAPSASVTFKVIVAG